MKKLIAANWKMNGSLEANAELVKAISSSPVGVDQVICPPAVYLQQVAGLVSGTEVVLGAQNLDWRESGAFTGEVSGSMLKEVGVSYVIVGHSERRSLFGETDQNCRDKALAAQQAGLIPIFCLGETKAERDEGEALNVVSRQLQQGLDGIALQSLVIAYEPVWAIGTGDTASPEQAEEVHKHIRSVLMTMDKRAAADVKILYGGSVNGSNAASLFAMENIDGALVGGASLKAEEFGTICRAGG